MPAMLGEIKHLLPIHVQVSLREGEREREREGETEVGTRKILSPNLSGGGPTAANWAP